MSYESSALHAHFHSFYIEAIPHMAQHKLTPLAWISIIDLSPLAPAEQCLLLWRLRDPLRALRGTLTLFNMPLILEALIPANTIATGTYNANHI